MLMSATLPGVSAKATGRPRSSARQWIFEVRPPRERPTACAHSPFCACRRAVRLHMRTVEAELARNIARSCNLLEQALPKPALRPSVVAIVDRGGRTIFGRNVAPTASGLENIRCRSIAAHASSDSLNRCGITASRLDEPNQKVESPNKAIDCMGSLSRIMNGRPSGRCCRTRRESGVVWTIDMSSTASAGCCDPAHRGAICRIAMAHAPPATTVSPGGEGPECGADHGRTCRRS